MHLRLKLTLFMIILVNISLILLGVINSSRSYEIVENSVETSAVEMVLTHCSVVNELTVKQMQMPHYLSIDEDVIDFLNDQESQEKFDRVTKKFDQYIFDKNNLEGVFLGNSEGTIVVAQSNNIDMIGTDLSDREYYKKTFELKESFISDTLYSRRTGAPMFAITVPVFAENRDDELIGFIGTIVYADSLSTYLKDMKLPSIESSYAFMLDGNNNYIYNPYEEMIGQNMGIVGLKEEIPEAQSLESTTGYSVKYSTGDEEMLAVFSKVAGTDWLLVVSGSLDELRAPIRNMNTIMVLVFIILSSIVTFIIFFGTKLITQPIINDLLDKNARLEEFNQELEESKAMLKETSDALYESEIELLEQNRELVESKQGLDRKNKLLEITLKASNEGIWFYEIIDKKVSFIDDFKTFKWFGQEILSTEDWENRIHPEDRDESRRKFMEFVEGKVDEFSIINRVLVDDENYHWVRSKGKAFFDEIGERSIVAGVHTDIDELKKNQEQLNYLAYYDSLTSIPNRINLLEELETSILNAETKETNMAVLFIDIDDFKRINDSMGHKFGDQVLIQSAKRLLEKSEDTEMVSRFGGDEFVVILKDIKSKMDAYWISDRFMEVFAEPFNINQSNIFLNVSIGIAVFPFDGNSAEELLTNADIAMYKAKQDGKNRVDFYNPLIKDDVVKRIELEKDLRQAINNEEFELHYQPQYNVKDNSLRGFEALIRWNKPEQGIVGPGGFINVAEDTGMIIKIGNWVLEEACNTLLKWTNEKGFDGIMSVNISPVQLKHYNFMNNLRNIVKETSINPKKLEIEITESILIESFDLTLEKLMEIRNMGIRISLDDFGTGYSSLSYLKNLPVDTLKIDKSFVDEIMQESKNREIVGSIVNLVNKLDMETVAEGVETAQQYEYLNSVECDSYQGYYMSKPLPKEDIEDSILNNT